MNDVEVLQGVRDLIDTEDKWTQTHYARDYSGGSVMVTDESACMWCLTGAIRHVVIKKLGEKIHMANEKRLAEERRIVILLFSREEIKRVSDKSVWNTLGQQAWEHFITWNDLSTTTWQDVLDLIDTAIKRQRKQMV